MDFKYKYLKYKNKYLNLVNIYGGSQKPIETELSQHLQDLIISENITDLEHIYESLHP